MRAKCPTCNTPLRPYLATYINNQLDLVPITSDDRRHILMSWECPQCCNLRNPIRKFSEIRMSLIKTTGRPFQTKDDYQWLKERSMW